MRILITGGPKTGKTTLSQTYPNPRHTDDLIHLPWSDQSILISYWLDEPGPWCIEGVAIIRGLRKWLLRRPNNQTLPFDKLIYLRRPYISQTPSQRALDLGTWTVYQAILPALKLRNADVRVLDRPSKDELIQLIRATLPV